jgi:succinate-semialdehyde dehydrogenase/glutarate-semialdehyde dehydrogenase
VQVHPPKETSGGAAQHPEECAKGGRDSAAVRAVSEEHSTAISRKIILHFGRYNGGVIQSINPATAQLERSFSPMSESELEDRIERSRQAFLSFRHTSFKHRKQWLTNAAALCEKEADRLARTITLEMGKPIKAARAEILKCATAFRYYAEGGEALLKPEEIDTGAKSSGVRYYPLGPVLAIMPWNFPFWQTIRFAAPALAAGNVALLKHAPSVPQCALLIEELFRDAGFPPDVFQTLLIDTEQTSKVIADFRVKAVTLTGSDRAGSQVAKQAGEHLKRVVLELGGSDPFIVMPSADLSNAVHTAVEARLINCGQSCIAAKRFIVHESIADEFERMFIALMQSFKVGDPTDENTQMGPLAAKHILDNLERQVRETVRMGARVLTGGNRMQRPGYFFEPTVLTDVPVDSPAYRDEMFGPVAVVFRVKKFEEAMKLANDTKFGLGASIWTRDSGEASRFIDEIESGMAFVNALVASDARLPFGGIKNSGFGRELGAYGMREFVNAKTYVVK